MGAGPLAGTSHETKIVLPTLLVRKFVGVRGAPEHAPGNVNVTLFDGGLVPATLVARTLSV